MTHVEWMDTVRRAINAVSSSADACHYYHLQGDPESAERCRMDVCRFAGILAEKAAKQPENS